MRAEEVRHGGGRAQVEPVAVGGVRHAFGVLGAVRLADVAVVVAEGVVVLTLSRQVIEVNVMSWAFFPEQVVVLQADVVLVALGRVRRELSWTAAMWLARVAQARAEVARSSGYGVAARRGVVLVEVVGVGTVHRFRR